MPKVCESGMPDAACWETFFNPECGVSRPLTFVLYAATFISLVNGRTAVSSEEIIEKLGLTITYDSLFRLMEDDKQLFKAGMTLAGLAKRDGEVEAMRRFIIGFAQLDEAKPSTPGILLPTLPRFAWIDERNQVQAAVPLLNSDDSAVQEAAEDLLIWIQINSRKQAKWEFFEKYLEEHPQRPPDYFVNHILKMSPPLALELFAGFYGWDHRDPEGKTLVAAGRRAARTLEYHLWMFTEGEFVLDAEERAEHLKKARGALHELLDMDRWWTNIVAADVVKRVREV